MELIKKNVDVCVKKHQFSTQAIVNEDLNLPDYMEDIEKVIFEKGEFFLEQVKSLSGKILIKGKVRYHLLYSGGNPENISSFVKETPVNEEIHADAVNEYDEVIVVPSEESVSLNVINSRKINARMIVGFDIIVQEIQSESITTDIRDCDRIQIKKKNCNLLKVCLQNNDIFRFYNQQIISRDKPNIENILYETISPREIELKCGDGNILITGRMHVFVMYEPEGRGRKPEWFDYEFPIDSKIECHESQQGMIGDLRWNLSGWEIEIKDDNENEPRVISVSGVLDIGMNIYEEEEISGVEDAYAIDKNVYPSMRTVMLPELLMKNNTICRIVKRMRVNDSDSSVVQICNIEGDVRQENISVESDMMIADGHVFVKILYATDAEEQPFRVATGAIPYSHNIEVGGISEGCKYRIVPLIESVSANLEGNDIEIRVQIAMDVIVFDYNTVQIIDEMGESDIPKELIKEMPGIVGYIAGNGEQLWDIAKRYHTTVEHLSEINRINDEPLKDGQKLIIIKEVV